MLKRVLSQSSAPRSPRGGASHADKRSSIHSDPNRPDDPQYIVRLVGQVIRVSLETVRIVKALPDEFC